MFCLRTEPGPLNPELSTIKKATAPPSLVKDNSDLKALVAERFNRAIKNKIFKYDNKTLTLQYFRSWYLGGHSCCTALLKMVEDWRLSLDEREAVATVAVDLSKAFDSVCHTLLLAKLKAYGFTEDALDRTYVMLFNRTEAKSQTGGVCLF